MLSVCGRLLLEAGASANATLVIEGRHELTNATERTVSGLICMSARTYLSTRMCVKKQNSQRKGTRMTDAKKKNRARRKQARETVCADVRV